MKKRIMWITFLIATLTLLLFSALSTSIYYHSSLEHTQQFLRGYTDALQEPAYGELDWDRAKAVAEKLGVRATFLDGEGNILYDTAGDEAGSSRADRPEVREAMEKGDGFDVRASYTLGKTYAYYCTKSGDGSYFIRLSLATSSMAEVYLESLPAVVVFLVVAALLLLLFNYLATDYMLRPVERLVRDAAQSKRVTTESEELRPIAEILNRLNDDIAARMAEIEKEKERVEEAQSSKDEFIANVTHEMNTPLTSIRGYSELLASGKLEGEMEKKAVETVLAQSERLSSLVASIINYSELDSGELPVYEVDASAVTREILLSLAPAIAEKHLVFRTEIAEKVLLQSRNERVSEVFGNLLSNAVRYNREGGEVEVRLTAREFSVSDTGIGISGEDLPRVFDRFFTADKSHGGKKGGFGLGLSVVKKLCEKAGWSIEAESKLGEGSRFTVRFSED